MVGVKYFCEILFLLDSISERIEIVVFVNGQIQVAGVLGSCTVLVGKAGSAGLALPPQLVTFLLLSGSGSCFWLLAVFGLVCAVNPRLLKLSPSQEAKDHT